MRINYSSQADLASPQSCVVARCGLRLLATLLGLALLPAAHAATAVAVDCSMAVGSKVVRSKSIALDVNGHGQGELYFEANMFVGSVEITADAQTIAVEMDIERNSASFTDSEFDFSRVRAMNRPGEPLGDVSVINGGLVCVSR